MMRTHTNNDLRKNDITKTVTLCGWVDTRRDHGGIIFIDLRDRYGLTQIVFDPEFEKHTHGHASKLHREDVIQVTGTVKERLTGMKNSNLATGDIEVFASKLNILNASEMPPMEVDDRKIPNESTRLRYRYLDLRRPSMQKKLIMRHTAAQATRAYFTENNFIEIETPMLLKHTPEGARDYIVPSRVHPGKVYSLPQSPQLYKQTLMISGFDRYFQLARCLRDEDLREDRQPEFTQIDIEMSFVEEEDIITMCEGLIKTIWKKTMNKNLKTPFPRMQYDEAVGKYGIDRPDLRFGLQLVDVTNIVKDSDFKVFRDVVQKNGIVKCINAEKANFTRTQIEEYTEFAKKHGAAGLAWMKCANGKLDSNIVKFFSEKIQHQLIQATKAQDGDILFFVAEKPKVCNDVLYRVRLKLGEDLKLINPEEQHFVWVVDFPMFDWNEEEKRWDAMHHPFTSPKPEHIQYLGKDPQKIKARAYDLVLNGIEIGGGSIRINRPDIQQQVLGMLGYSIEEANEKFGFLLEALKFGAPPHGGLAFGFDRLCALLAGTQDIREVIAFPKTKSAENPMDGSPSPISDKNLKELNLELNAVAKKNLGK